MFVTTGNDVVNASDGVVSLREAVKYSNDNPAPAGDRNRIEFATYVNAASLTGTQLQLSKDVRILGNGSGNTTVQRTGTAKFRLFEVVSGTKATFEGLTLTNGLAPAAGMTGGYGGAILSAGTLAVTNCALTDNSAEYGGYAGKSYGGAIRGDSGSVTIEGSSLELNSAQHGGAISVGLATLTIKNSVLLQNLAQYNGGAIQAAGTTVTLDGVEVGLNSANDRGGGLWVTNTTLTLKGGSEVYENSTAGKGGGVYIDGGGVVYAGVTFSNNTGSEGDGVYRINATRTGKDNVDVFLVNDKEAP